MGTGKFTKALSDPAVTVLLVERRERLTSFGFEHLQACLAACGRRVVVLDETETTLDLLREVIEVLNHLCAGLCGRSATRRAAKAVAVVTGGGRP